MRHHTPGGSGAHHPAQAIKYVSQVVMPLSRIFGQQGQIGRNESPFVVAHITGIGISRVHAMILAWLSTRIPNRLYVVLTLHIVSCNEDSFLFRFEDKGYILFNIHLKIRLMKFLEDQHDLRRNSDFSSTFFPHLADERRWIICECPGSFILVGWFDIAVKNVNVFVAVESKKLCFL